MEDIKRPQHLDTFTYLMGILNLTGYLFVTGGEETKTMEYVLVTLIILFSYWCLYYFQKGAAWSRILVLIASVLVLFNLFGIFFSSTWVQFVLVVEASLGASLLYWLSTKPVRIYFSTKR
tara:strand:- start:5230 stop:5589 length:360 start_codon:yes stop_codon:yes gene_type:complete